MNPFFAALWAEALKARRSKVSLLILAAITLLPVVDGLFMVILKDPARAQEMGLIGAKAQLAAGSADWPTFFYVLVLGTAMAGAILFAFITAWVFGREFSDHTTKEWLALPTSRSTVVAAKFVLIAAWILGLALWIFGLGLAIAKVVDIPGDVPGLASTSLGLLLAIALLSYMLLPFVALFASAGRGYLPPLGWAILTLVLSQIAITMGWGDLFPWAVPGLLGEMAGPRGLSVAPISYVLVAVTFLAGLAATFVWWQRADQSR